MQCMDAPELPQCEIQQCGGLLRMPVNASGLYRKSVELGSAFKLSHLQPVLKKLKTALNVKTAARSYQKVHLALGFVSKSGYKGITRVAWAKDRTSTYGSFPFYSPVPWLTSSRLGTHMRIRALTAVQTAFTQNRHWKREMLDFFKEVLINPFKADHHLP